MPFVQAYFATRGRTFRAHGARDSAIQRDPEIRAVYEDYRELQDYSSAARYDVGNFTRDDVTAAAGTLGMSETARRAERGVHRTLTEARRMRSVINGPSIALGLLTRLSPNYPQEL